VGVGGFFERYQVEDIRCSFSGDGLPNFAAPHVKKKYAGKHPSSPYTEP